MGGHVSEKAFYRVGKLQGEVVDYNEDGTVRDTNYYENGKLIDKKKFAVSPQNPLWGVWKRNPLAAGVYPTDATWTFYANGIYEGRFFNEKLPTPPEIGKANWKYIPVNSASGFLEVYLGDELTWKDAIRWINRNQFESTFVVSPDRNDIGKQWTFMRQQR